MRKTFLFSLMAILLGTVAFGSGFAIYEHGARAMGVSGAFTARASDPSAIWFNPAGMTQLDGTHFYAGGTLIVHGSTYTNDLLSLEVESDDSAAFPPNFYITHQLTKNLWVGVGVNSPFGLAKTWPLNNPIIYASKNTEMLTIFATGALAYKASDCLSVGASISYVYADVTWERYQNIDPLVTLLTSGAVTDVDDMYFKAEVDKDGWIFSGGLQWKITPSVVFGAQYRSGLDLKFEGDATFDIPTTNIPAVDALLPSLFPDQSGSATFVFPAQIFAGFAFYAGDKWEFEVDLYYTFWSKYETLNVDFSQETSLYGTPVLSDLAIPKNWEDSWSIRGGLEYHASPAIDLRFGGVYDTTPIPDETLDPQLPDNERVGLTAGLGYHKKGFIVDVAYMLLLMGERSATNAAFPLSQTYKANQSHLFGINIGYSF